MDSYVTGSLIRTLREQKGLTQAQLAEGLSVSDKTVSKWECGRGLPDVSLLEPLAAALGASVPELMNGCTVTNSNTAGNMQRLHFYVCPLCGNIITAVGAAVISCCGVTLPPLEAEPPDADHALRCERVEDEYYLTVEHPMTKQHSITFFACVTGDRAQIVRLYPEGNAEARFFIRGHAALYAYCNHHGLFRCSV